MTIYTIKARRNYEPRHIEYHTNTIHGSRQRTAIEKAGFTILQITKTEYGPKGPTTTNLYEI